MELVRFFALIIQITMALALAGQLKSCTLEVLGLAAESSKTGMTSYSRFTELLLKDRSDKK